MSSLLLKNVHAVDIGTDKVCDIFISDGIIRKIGESIFCDCDKEIDCSGLTAMPALFDMHVHFRDPGLTYKEDIVTGCNAALAGGFTGVLLAMYVIDETVCLIQSLLLTVRRR